MIKVKNVVICGSCLRNCCFDCSNFIGYERKEESKKESLLKRMVEFFKLVLNFN